MQAWAGLTPAEGWGTESRSQALYETGWSYASIWKLTRGCRVYEGDVHTSCPPAWRWGLKSKQPRPGQENRGCQENARPVD